jgi:hypothetical protein
MEARQECLVRWGVGRGVQYWIEGEGTTMVEETDTEVGKFLKENGRKVVQRPQG